MLHSNIAVVLLHDSLAKMPKRLPIRSNHSIHIRSGMRRQPVVHFFPYTFDKTHCKKNANVSLEMELAS